MRRLASNVVAVTLVAALGFWVGFSRTDLNLNPPAAAQASINTILPLELHAKAGKNLPDTTVREPF